MTLAISAALLNSERRDTSVSGTRAVLSSQQLMELSKHCRETRALRLPDQVDARGIIRQRHDQSRLAGSPCPAGTAGDVAGLGGCGSQCALCKYRNPDNADGTHFPHFRPWTRQSD